MPFKQKVLKVILTHTFLVLETVELGQKIICFNWGSTCRKVWEPLG